MASPPQPSRRIRLRRVDSFRRLSSLPEHLQQWFFTNKHLHIEIEGFFEDLVHEHNATIRPLMSTMILASNNSSSNNSGSNSSASLLLLQQQQLPHELHEYFSQFCVKFESLLSEELEASSVTNEEFEAVMEIAALEERRDGVHFYRWVEILNIEVFAKMLMVALKLEETVATLAIIMSPTGTSGGGGHTMTSPTQQHLVTSNLAREEFPAMRAALTAITKLSDVARASRRRRKDLKPIVFSWSPPDFSSIMKMIESCSASLSTRFQPPKSTLKELARWRNRLLTKTLNASGVYSTPPRSDEDWLNYLELLCEGMPDDVFGDLVQGMNAYIKQDASSRSEAEAGAMLDRRAVWELFAALDVTFTDRVDLHDWLSELSSPAVAEELFGGSHQQLVETDEQPHSTLVEDKLTGETHRSRAERSLHKLTLRSLAEYRTNHGNDKYIQELAERQQLRQETTSSASLRSSSLASFHRHGSSNNNAASALVISSSSSTFGPVAHSPKQQDLRELRGICELQMPLALSEFTHVVLLTFQLTSEHFRQTHSDIRGMCRVLLQHVGQDE